jgi:hypothetical protein
VPFADEALRLADDLNGGAAVLVVGAPARIPWLRLAPVLVELERALGTRVVRHELRLTR